MRLVLYEPNHGGHHFAYLARMLPGFLKLPVEVILATTAEGVASEEFAKTLAPYRDRIRIETRCTQQPRGTLRNGLHRTRELLRIVKELEPDHLGIVYSDGIWQILAAQAMMGRRPLANSVMVEAWLYRGDFAAPRRDSLGHRIRRMLFKRLIQSGMLAALHVDHELLHDYAERNNSNGTTRCVLTPNPVWLGPPLDRVEARRRLGLVEHGRLLVSTGMIASWKGMDLLIEAFEQHLREGPEADDRLLLGGPHSVEIRRMLETEPYLELVRAGRIISLDRFLNEEEMYTCAAAGDLTVAAYPRHSGRSSIILWAAAAGRPSLGTEWGCIGHVIRTQGLGLTCDVLDLEAFAASLNEGLEMQWTEEDAARVRAYAKSHSIENYQRVASALVRERLAVKKVLQ